MAELQFNVFSLQPNHRINGSSPLAIKSKERKKMQPFDEGSITTFNERHSFFCFDCFAFFSLVQLFAVVVASHMDCYPRSRLRVQVCKGEMGERQRSPFFFLFFLGRFF